MLDECLRRDPLSRVACETYVTMGMLIVGGEVTTNTILDAIEDDERSIAPPTSGQARRPVLREIPKVTSPLEYLTYREQEVLRLLAQRQYNKEIADTLSVSIETVKTHVKHVFQKLEVSSRREAIARANALGLLADRLNES